MEAKARNARLDHWLAPNIIVKVMSKELKEAGYYKQKVRAPNPCMSTNLLHCSLMHIWLE